MGQDGVSDLTGRVKRGWCWKGWCTAVENGIAQIVQEESPAFVRLSVRHRIARRVLDEIIVAGVEIATAAAAGGAEGEGSSPERPGSEVPQ